MKRDLPITLAMVSYNKHDTIDLSIESAAKGSMRPDFLVISDDGSSDGTTEVAERTAAKFGIPCRIIHNLRVGRFRLQTMRNTVVANALNGVVFISDSDCIFGEHCVESHWEIHRQHPFAIGTGPRYEYLEGNSGPFKATFQTLEYAHFPAGHYCTPVGANFSFRKTTWKRLGGFDRAYEGAYGMDEFQFSLSAESAGAVCVSDPGAYLFHIPHDTLFGSRGAWRNIGVFNDTYGRNHIEEERVFVEDRSVPWYVRGMRKRPILGDRVELDEWGAPAGFVPPPDIELARSLRPLVAPVERYLETRGAEDLVALKHLVAGLDWRRHGHTTPAHVKFGELHHLMNDYKDLQDLENRLKWWLDNARVLARGEAPQPEHTR
ncbi:MAG: glycosyltransferase family 2 protein [Planctomycetes bacterium]|nr:glycosyltransferase family 2 protein [Planctomycetota bacterium]